MSLISDFEGIIGAVIGILITYWIQKAGEIKLIDKGSWLSTPEEGKESKNRYNTGVKEWRQS